MNFGSYSPRLPDPTLGWGEVMKEGYDVVKGFQEANKLTNEEQGYEMTYRAKPIPRTLLLRWEDRYSADSGNGQYTRFSFKLPTEINNYDSMSLLQICFNADYFTLTNKHFIVLGIEGFNAGSPLTSADANGKKRFMPTWIVPDQTSSTLQFQNSNSFLDAAKLSIRDRDLRDITLNLGNEDLARNTVVGLLPGPAFYCNMLFYLE